LARLQPDLPHDKSVSYTHEFRRCGRPACSACTQGGRGHGPYLYVRWSDGVTRHKRYLGKARPPAGRAGGDSRPPGAPSDETTPLDGGDPFYVQTLGRFAVWRDGRPVPSGAWARGKTGILFKALLVAPSHRLTRAQAMDLLWPDPDPDVDTDPATLLRQVLHRLRHSLDGASPLIVDDKGTLVLDVRYNGASVPHEDWLDAAAFDRAARRALDDPDPASAMAALDLYHGPFLPDDAGSADEFERVRYERGRLHDLYVTLQLHLARLMASRGDVGGAIRLLRDVQRQNPADEATALQLMALQAAAGEVDGALRAYEDLRDALREHRGVTPSRHVEDLHTKLREQRAAPRAADRPPRGGGPVRATNLPAARTSFVGRANERHDVHTALAGTRLLTLTGPGGCGKSRLALAVADDLVIAYPDGVWLVELAALADPVLVPVAIAAALGVREEMGHPLSETLAAFLAPRYLLLVLDNCERMTSICAPLTDALLRAAPGLRILATSRIPLDTIGETTWDIPPMAVPPPDAPGDLARLTGAAGYDAVRLFVERARDIRARITGHDAGRAVAEICRRLDGLPLAIELAAARLPLVPLREMPVRLDDRLCLLGGGSPGALPHQQTLRATLDWSHALLNGAEQTLFRRLAVFVGGWTPEMAARVCAAEGLGGAAIPGVLEALTRQSLLRREEMPDGGRRYGMLETVREYATERLGASGDADALRRRHAEEMLALALRVEPELTDSDQVRWLERLEIEHDNLRAALAWAQQQAATREAGLRLAAALWRFWDVRGYWGEGRRWLDVALANTQGAVPTLRAQALRATGNLVRSQGNLVHARALYEESAALHRAMGDARGLAGLLGNLGNIAYQQGDLAHARVLQEEALTLFRDSGDALGGANTLSNLGNVTFAQGDLARADALYQESLARQREVGHIHGVANALSNLGHVAAVVGDHARAWALQEESMALYRALGDTTSEAVSLYDLGHVALVRGDVVRARALMMEGLDLMARLSSGTLPPNYLEEAITTLAQVAVAQGQHMHAVRLLGAAAAVREATALAIPPHSKAESARAEADARAALGEDVYRAVWQEGRALPPDAVIALTRR